ncbi:MAG: prolyl oligopeptidase family serine peptidase, partial [Bacteroidales bacterium]|nr:prolyl oligopeptidase family serine peptidase [Bacteroidales bacterium]
TILTEKSNTFFESGYNKVNWKVLFNTNEVIWFSQSSNWGHLYLINLKNGSLKHAITKGKWNVLQVLRLDEAHRMIYFTGAGREPGDPYFQYFYRVRMNGSDLTLLTPDSANHTISLSQDGKYFIDTYSTPTTPPVIDLRNAKGGKVLTLEKADISQLLATGWKPPIPFSVKARDGVTDLYGLMFVPSNLDPHKKYPIINSIYPGPQTGSVGSRNFSPSRGDKQALAELGFVVVSLDAMGTPMRSKSFHAAYYGNMGDNGLPDQITGMKQLAARYPWIDINRAGIYGHSGGGFAAADAILRYPGFFKVAVSEAGNHDNRTYEDDWGEKWQGLLTTRPDGTTNYDNQANQLLAGNLKGKLLLAHGTMDSNVPPNNTLLLVNALIAANKDFDLILFPNRGHGFGGEPYMIRRRWDYFVKNLMGAEPPKEYEFEFVNKNK